MTTMKENEPQKRLDGMLETVSGLESILILVHNNPDPDAIASAVALKFLLAEQLGIESHIVHGGIIGRAENKALVRCLGFPLRQLSDLNLDKPLPVAYVDTQPDTGHHAAPAASVVTIVIDHHPLREATGAAKYVDVREDVGAVSTILTEYLQAAGLEPTPLLATALFYGIKTDTRGLGRNSVGPADVAAYAYLQSRLDIEILAEIEYAQVSADYFKGFDAALQAAHTYEGIVIAYAGRMNYPDMAAETADFLLRLEGVEWVICTGEYEGILNLSIRTRRLQGGAGRLAQAVVLQDGVAGGHGVTAGGQVPLMGRDPAQVAKQIGQRALHYLNVTPEVAGRPLI